MQQYLLIVSPNFFYFIYFVFYFYYFLTWSSSYIFFSYDIYIQDALFFDPVKIKKNKN